MKVLVIGSGGREHAICKAIASSPMLTKGWCMPGNPGIAQVMECVPITNLVNKRNIVNFANVNQVSLVIVGPEAPLVDGLADDLAVFGIACCGPNKHMAQLEGSKYFTKQLCTNEGIPTADWQVFFNADRAREYLLFKSTGCLISPSDPIVIKADGLAAGKGVVVATSLAEAFTAIDDMMEKHVFDEAGNTIIIEEYLEGTEVSFFALCDGSTALPFGTAQDYKRAYDGNQGPNTGGMGAISPAPAMTHELHADIWSKIIMPAVKAMGYKGILFAGIMVAKDGPKLIEFNVRFGDPECQAMMMRLESDLLWSLWAVGQRALNHTHMPILSNKTSVAVVMAAPGYPAAPKTGSKIEIHANDGIIYHCGTTDKNGYLAAAGGRVLTVGGLGDDVDEARRQAYDTIDFIDWPEGQYRKDIGL